MNTALTWLQYPQYLVAVLIRGAGGCTLRDGSTPYESNTPCLHCSSNRKTPCIQGPCSRLGPAYFGACTACIETDTWRSCSIVNCGTCLLTLAPRLRRLESHELILVEQVRLFDNGLDIVEDRIADTSLGQYRIIPRPLYKQIVDHMADTLAAELGFGRGRE